jgi:hypothetical protein
MFYPYPNALGFSDNHAGSAMFYVAFRFLGFDQYQAFKGWFAIGYVGTFIAAYIVLVRLQSPPLIAGMGAFLFAFCLPSVAQFTHAQLNFRWGVPFAFFYSFQLVRTKAPSDLYKLITAFSAQFLFSIYLGFFTVIYCSLLFLLLLWPFGRTPKEAGPGAFAEFRNCLKRKSLLTHSLFVAVLMSAASVFNLVFYYYVSRQYEIQRSWDHIYSMIPRAQSYLLMDSLPYWASISEHIQGIPTRNEHQLFLGIPTIALFVAALVFLAWHEIRGRMQAQRVMWAMTVTVCLAFALFLALGPATIYGALGALPGVGAIRAVTRHILVGAFPVIMVGCLFLTQVLQRPEWSRWAAVLPAVFVAWHAFDVWSMQKAAFSSDDARKRISVSVAAIKAGGNYSPDKVLAYFGNVSESWYVRMIDGMLIAQELRIPSLNGYSAFFVPGYDINGSCAGFLRQLFEYRAWAERKSQPALEKVWKWPLVVKVPCSIDQDAVNNFSATSGPGLSRQAAATVRLTIVSRKEMFDGWGFVIRVTNNSAETIHAISANPFKLSWRMSVGQLDSGHGWDTRIDVPVDIPSGRHIDIPFILSKAGTDTPQGFSFSFVVEGLFWGHDVGVTPISSLEFDSNKATATERSKSTGILMINKTSTFSQIPGAGDSSDALVEVKSGHAGTFVFYGPYWKLAPGFYHAVMNLEPHSTKPEAGHAAATALMSGAVG